MTVVLGATVGDRLGLLRWPDGHVLMRITDFFLILPTFVLALILSPIIRDTSGDGRDLRDADRPSSRSSSSSASRAGPRRRGSSAARPCRCKERAFVDRARVIGADRVGSWAPHRPERDVADRREHRAHVRGPDPDRDGLSFIGLGDPFAAVVGRDPRLAQVPARPARGVVVHGGAGRLRSSSSSSPSR